MQHFEENGSTEIRHDPHLRRKWIARNKTLSRKLRNCSPRQPTLARQDYLFAEIEHRRQQARQHRRMPECQEIRQRPITSADIVLYLHRDGIEIQEQESPRQKAGDIRLVAPPRRIKDTSPCDITDEMFTLGNLA